MDTATRDAIVLGALGLTFTFARRLRGVRSWRGLEVEDLQQEAALGLLKAAEAHNPSRGSLGTLAFLCGRQACSRAAQRQPPLTQVPLDVDGREVEPLAPVEDDVEARLDVRDALAQLPPRSAEVVLLRFGLDGQPPLSLKAIGRALGVSRERARQLEARAIFELRTILSR